MAVALAAGPGAVLSHRSAAALWNIHSSSMLEVTVPCRRRSRRGVVVHRSALPPDEVTLIDGIPLTTVPRTLLDLAAVLRPALVERAINEAEYMRLSDPLSLDDVLTRYPRRKGRATIGVILARRRAGDRQRSELEVRFVEFLDAYGLPRPAMNAQVEAGGTLYECDCVWRAARLIVELDSRSAHDTTASFERDRARDRALAVAEWRVIRVTWRALHEDPAGLAVDLREVTSPRWQTT